ncbi:MAG: GNAT family N-acetyltransferase [Candidatus Velthaea sp.]
MQAQRLQSFLRESVRARAETIASGPFECFFDRHDPLVYLNYAIPLKTARGDELAGALRHLEAVFRTHERVPRFEFVPAVTPALEPALLAAGYCSESQATTMVCDPSSLKTAGFPLHAVAFHDERTADAEIVETLAVRARAFGLETPADATAVAAYRASAKRSPHAVVRVDGRIAGAGMLTSAYDGVAEIGGIGVLEGYRRRGYGGALTAALAARGFGGDLRMIHLTAGSRAAASVYANVGFRESDVTVAAYIKPPEST